MPDKLTDEQIKKAFEWCTKADCVNCPHIYLNCRFDMARKALDLINRLQAENERLKEEKETLKSLLNSNQERYFKISNLCHKYRNKLKTVKAENERLRNTIDDMLDREPILVERSEKYAKAEAYKEFAELLHCHCEGIINQPHNENVRPISWKVAYEEFDEKIDNLLKELIKEQEYGTK